VGSNALGSPDRAVWEWWIVKGNGNLILSQLVAKGIGVYVENTTTSWNEPIPPANKAKQISFAPDGCTMDKL